MFTEAIACSAEDGDDRASILALRRSALAFTTGFPEEVCRDTTACASSLLPRSKRLSPLATCHRGTSGLDGSSSSAEFRRERALSGSPS